MHCHLVGGGGGGGDDRLEQSRELERSLSGWTAARRQRVSAFYSVSLLCCIPPFTPQILLGGPCLIAMPAAPACDHANDALAAIDTLAYRRRRHLQQHARWAGVGPLSVSGGDGRISTAPGGGGGGKENLFMGRSVNQSVTHSIRTSLNHMSWVGPGSGVVRAWSVCRPTGNLYLHSTPGWARRDPPKGRPRPTPRRLKHHFSQWYRADQAHPLLVAFRKRGVTNRPLGGEGARAVRGVSRFCRTGAWAVECADGVAAPARRVAPACVCGL